MSKSRSVPAALLVTLLLALPAVAAGPPKPPAATPAPMAWSQFVVGLQALIARFLPAPAPDGAHPKAPPPIRLTPQCVSGTDPNGRCL